MSVALFATVACGAAVVGIAAVSVASFLWRRTTATRNVVLMDLRRGVGPASKPVSSADLSDLPAPVARYFAFALPEGQRRICSAAIRWTGEMKLAPTARWGPYTADQLCTVSPRGYVWAADFQMHPLMVLRIRDSLVGGVGSSGALLGGLLPVGNISGTRELAESSLMRWLGEAVWFPTALLPGAGVQWAPIDLSSARATVTDGAVSVSADFHFAPSGEPLRFTGLRYRAVASKQALTPFDCTYERCTRQFGMLVPSASDAAWIMPDQSRFAFWRGRPTIVQCELESS